MIGLPQEQLYAPVTWLRNEPAISTDAVVTIAAPGAGKRTVIYQIDMSYQGGTFGGGNLNVTINGVVVWKVEFEAFETTSFFFPKGLCDTTDAGLNVATVVTLTDGGADVFGIVNVCAG